MNSTSISTKLFIILLFIIFLLSSQALLAQVFDTVWTTTYHDNISNIKAIVTAENNSFLAVSNSYPKSLVSKFNSNGDTLWNTEITHERFLSNEITIYDIAVGKNGNYMALSEIGHYSSWNAYHDSTLVTSISPEGKVLSQFIYGGGIHYRNYCITSSKTGGYYIAGGYKYTKSAISLPIMKIADNGSELKRIELDIINFDWGQSFDLIETSDTNLVVCGYKYVMKLDRYLNEAIWTNMDDTLSEYQFMWIRETPDGGFLTGVNTRTHGAINKLIKFDVNGNLLWINKLNIDEYNSNELNITNAEVKDYKFDELHMTDAVVNKDGTIVLTGAGRTNYGGFQHLIFKISEDAEILTYYLYDNLLYPTSAITQLSDGDFVVAGFSDYQVGLFVRYTLTPGTDVNSINENIPEKFALSQNYPNPFNPSTTINYSIPTNAFNASATNVQLKIYDVLGREVATLVNKEQTPGNYSVKFDAAALKSGMYLYKIQAGNFSESKKMLLIK